MEGPPTRCTARERREIGSRKSWSERYFGKSEKKSRLDLILSQPGCSVIYMNNAATSAKPAAYSVTVTLKSGEVKTYTYKGEGAKERAEALAAKTGTTVTEVAAPAKPTYRPAVRTSAYRARRWEMHRNYGRDDDDAYDKWRDSL